MIENNLQAQLNQPPAEVRQATQPKQTFCDPEAIKNKRVAGNMLVDQGFSTPEKVSKRFKEFFNANPNGCVSYDTNLVETLTTDRSRDTPGAIIGARVIEVTFFTSPTDASRGEIVRFLYSEQLEKYLNTIQHPNIEK